MDQKVLYDLTPSQQVPLLQCKFTLFKRVINILCSSATDKPIDWKVMKEAFNKVVERNDCLRIQFVKKGGKVKQYFRESVVFDEIPYLEFKDHNEFMQYIDKYKNSAIKYKKGKVIEPTFVKIGKKYMVLLKVCHLVLDVYGINVIFRDLFEVYEALKNKSELPEEPTKFEDIVKKDIKYLINKEKIEKETEFFTEYLSSRENPKFTGIAGKNCEIWNKQVAKGKPYMKMFFIKNDTVGTMYPISSSIIKKVKDYCEKTKLAMSNFMFYTASMAESLINDKTENMIHLELCNCRGTVTEKKAGGDKVQSISCYTHIDYNKSFNENFIEFCDLQKELYKHVGYPDTKFQTLYNKIYKMPLMDTLYSLCFSLIPYVNPKGVEFQVYSNGKGALPLYVALMYDVETDEIKMAYDYQTKIATENDVKNYHDTYVKVIQKVIENCDKKLNEVF